MQVAIIACFFFAYGLTYLVIKRAHVLNLIDIPNNRSSHIEPTPRAGGMAVVFAAVLGSIWIYNNQLNSNLYIILVIALGLLIALTGLIDDIYSLSSKSKFAVQIIVSSILVYFFQKELSALSISIFGADQFYFLALTMIGLLFLLLWWINLFNFMDGIDGLAATEGIFILISLPLVLFVSTNYQLDIAQFSYFYVLASAILGFLIWNWAPAKIFLGDVGSTYIAFIIFALLLITAQIGTIDSFKLFYLWIILSATFFSDATVTLLTRMLKGEVWYKPHRTHLYQILALKFNKLGYTHAPVTLIYTSINVFWLLPISMISQVYPELFWYCPVIAYAPLVSLCLYLGAGRYK